MYQTGTIRLLVIFAVAFSLITIPGPLSSNFHLPTLSIAHATAAPNNPWLPAGPASDHMTTPIFTDQVAEFNNLVQGNPPGSASSIDLTDNPLTPGLISRLTTNASFLVTQPIEEHGYYEVEMDMSNTFWNCNFNFGNSTCGINIRQGIAHLFDKQAFVTNDPNILNNAVAIDNPVPIDNGGLSAPNTCNWDLLYNESTNCFVGSNDPTNAFYTGGNAYRLAKAPSNSNSLGAQPNPSPDFCAAAGHFIAAGVATGVVTPPSVSSKLVWWQHQPSDWTITSGTTNCQLTGIIAGTIPSFWIITYDVRRLDLENILAGQICLLFTGSSSFPCQFLNSNRPFCEIFCNNFPGFFTSPQGPANNWWFYTASFVGVYPFDSSLYYTYNSRFVSGLSSIEPPCSAQAVGTYSASNYMYLCDPIYDNLSNQMEFAPCLRSNLNNDIDSQIGIATPTFRDCAGNPAAPSSSGLTSLSAGYQAEDRFGRRAYAIPIFNPLDTFAYENNGFLRVVSANLGGTPNINGVGISNYYSWLDSWNANHSTIRQGFEYTTRSMNPYIASSPLDHYILANIYDRLGRTNPYAPFQLFNWMTVSTTMPCNSTMQCGSSLTYPPPSGTVATYRFTLRSDLFFQDGKQVTSFDVAFSYLSLLASGAFQSTGAAPVIAITVLSPIQFDMNLKANGPTTLFHLMSLSILPGRYWTGTNSTAWDSALANCSMNVNCYPSQYSVNYGLIGSNMLPTVVCDTGTGLTNCPFSPSNLNVDATKISAAYDPLASGTLIGSGPWMCVSTTGVRGGGCTASGTQNPDVGTNGYTLTRFGLTHSPGTSLTDGYFRSDGNTALWFWSGNTGDFTHDFLNFGTVARCVGAPIGIAGCTQWQNGIGGEMNGSPSIIQPIPQASITARFVGVDLVSEAANLARAANPTAGWTPTTVPMIAVGPANSFDGFPAPTLYEGSKTLNPASVAGCTTGYPVGGYDC